MEMSPVDGLSDSGGAASIVLVTGATLAIVGFLIATTVPFTSLFGLSSHTPIAAFHGMIATVLLVVSPIGVASGIRLLRGITSDVRTLKVYTVAISAIAFVAIAFGNWTLIGYRAAGGAREWLKANNPEVHGVIFEFKEYLGLFTLPLAVVTAYLVWRYQDRIVKDRAMRETVGVLLSVTFLFFLATFVLGAAVARVRAV